MSNLEISYSKMAAADPIPLSSYSPQEDSEQSINQPQTSPEWRYWVSLFAEDLEYDYILAVSSNGRKISMRKEVRVKDSGVGINFNASGKTPEERIEILQLQKGNETKASLADVLLYWNESKSALCAVRQCDADVYYYSHINGGEKKEMKTKESEVIYNFEKFCSQLSENESEIKFNPRQTKLRFGKKNDDKVTYVTLLSRTAGSLYDTFT